MNARANRPIAAWLLACCALVFLMVVVGGVTRLTHSGLSMTEWQPLIGAVPPLDHDQWTEVFDKYRQTPEYRKVNSGMSLDEFKGIFWWEYSHRLLGRSIGAVFLVPFLFFLVRGRIGPLLARRLAFIFVLGALQGALGWFMVKSGLVDDPHVSAYRLTAHLGLAVLIYAALLRAAWGLLFPGTGAADPRMAGARRLAGLLAALVFLMILTGGLVAGTRAGFAYNTFPLMEGRWVPEGALALEPWFLNFFENIPTVQFDHRVMALVLALATALLWFRIARLRPDARIRAFALALPAALAVQIGLGIGTLLLAVPVALAAGHQAGALLVFTAAVLLHRELGRA